MWIWVYDRNNATESNNEREAKIFKGLGRVSPWGNEEMQQGEEIVPGLLSDGIKFKCRELQEGGREDYLEANMRNKESTNPASGWGTMKGIGDNAETSWEGQR